MVQQRVYDPRTGTTEPRTPGLERGPTTPTRVETVTTTPRPTPFWGHWVNALAGIWLFLSPWMLPSTENGAWNAWITGAIVLVIAFAALSNARAEWGNVVAGAWLFLSPWFIAMTSEMSWNAWIVGALVFFVALASVNETRNRFRRATATHP